MFHCLQFLTFTTHATSPPVFFLKHNCSCHSPASHCLHNNLQTPEQETEGPLGPIPLTLPASQLTRSSNELVASSFLHLSDQLFLNSLSKHILGAYCVPDIVRRFRDSVIKSTVLGQDGGEGEHCAHLLSRPHQNDN